ncbi:D-arabinitol dehydrogenase 1 isoform X2 [Nasonia vitripennis]|uniref:Enoyl reductase (ER) domain-containing protein n=1 Tax=Nasonia vitripennis TaxID=7425 RepID=A0A7M7QYC9_NASVI|nr:D-arabinitol dehydrogenase 1 isoform X2 [Nasonia vitripennis]XP_032454647.1 D-arabinitol dehydrogenase 1 isoform X2 [Nasonia vitripennis]XP_032454651.1 D-arabinitol dehydrogenase 1 isoform X2 [Nasonia vitripennis]
MESLSFDASRKSLTLQKASIPKPKDDEVLIRVAYSGICGTDLHILEGTFPCKQNEPLIPGHEFCGTVEAVGVSVKNFKVGQRVTVDPNSGCSMCDDCHVGCYHLCVNGGVNSTIGIFRNGGWATHCCVPEVQVYHVPEGVEMEQAALSEPLSCLAHGWKRMNPIHVGQKVLVLGAGIIGLLWSSILHLHGLRKTVTVSEPQDKRKEMAKKMGLDYQVTSPAELKGNEYDVIVDCSGSGPAMESAIPLLARGGRFCIFGVADPKVNIKINPYEMYKKELTIYGVNINPFSFSRGIGLLKAMASSYLQYDNLGIKVFKLSEYNVALDALKNGTISKAVFKL